MLKKPCSVYWYFFFNCTFQLFNTNLIS